MADNGPTLRDVIDRLDGIALDVGALKERIDEFEYSATEAIKAGLADVVAAVENFATTKADRADVEALRADVDELKRAAGE